METPNRPHAVVHEDTHWLLKEYAASNRITLVEAYELVLRAGLETLKRDQ